MNELAEIKNSYAPSTRLKHFISLWKCLNGFYDRWIVPARVRVYLSETISIMFMELQMTFAFIRFFAQFFLGLKPITWIAYDALDCARRRRGNHNESRGNKKILPKDLNVYALQRQMFICLSRPQYTFP